MLEEGVSKLLITTVPGLEDLLLAELKPLPGSGMIKRGKVIYTLAKPMKGGELGRFISRLTLAEKVYAVLTEGYALSLEEIKRLLSTPVDLVSGMANYPLSFAVEAAREGVHPFTSLDISRVVGSAIQEKHPRLRVSLDDPDLLFYAELMGREFRLAIDLTPFTSLRDRGYRVYVHPSSLNPIVARAMCRLANLRDGETLVDPLCGGGTIVIEGLLESPLSRGVGFDVNPAHVRGAMLNAASAGVVADFWVADARHLSSLLGHEVDVIATNPPYGIREKAVGGLKRLYFSLIEEGYTVLEEGGRLVILSPLKRIVERAAREQRWRPSSVRKIDLGGLTSFIFLFRKWD
ncbi:MAG: THUMP domain-containing protein [Thermofilaceae archaeon]